MAGTDEKDKFVFPFEKQVFCEVIKPASAKTPWLSVSQYPYIL